MAKLAYYVYIENINRRSIEKYNVLSDHMLSIIRAETREITDRQSFSDKVKSILMYHFWSKSEWEIVLTDWPPHITVSEINRLQEEVTKHNTQYGDDPRSVCVRLSVSEKIDVYDQVMLNWDIFIDYLWNNLRC